MAKMFYSLEEVQERLGQSAEQIELLVAAGKLRKFLDGAKIMFKVDEVDQLDLSSLSSTGSAAGEIRLMPEDSAAQAGATSGDSAADISLGGTDIGDQVSLDDTGPAADKDDTVITTHGTNVFSDSDELEPIDPLAQTQMAPDLEDQVSLDSGSSGSGLLDLTREADDTSLGAELLEEIYPGSEEGAIETQLPTQMEVPTVERIAELEAQAPTMADYTQVAEVYDQTSGAFGAMMVVPFVMLIYLGCVAAASVAGVRPRLLSYIGDAIWYVAGGAVVLAAAIAVVGYILAGRSDQPAKPKIKPKAKPKEKAKARKK